MSQENVNLVEVAIRAWNAGDMERLAELLDPEIVVRMPEGWPEPGPFVEREAVMRLWEEARNVWDSDRLEPTSDFLDAGERVVLRFIWRGGGLSVPDSQLEFTAVYTVRSCKVVGQESFWEHTAALRAVGLAE
jgi:ketosteroid isomerase-like protein